MKKITLVAVGRLKENFFVSAADEYIKRLKRFCDLKIIELSEAEGKLSEQECVAKESDAILAAVKNQRFFLLDIEGELFKSEEFSAMIEGAHLLGDAVFVIGGSCGVDRRVKQAAGRLVSFGRFTYPHRLMRVMLLEQLYRAMTISAGLPYHK